MTRSRIGDYLSYGLTGAALGTGSGALFNSAANGEQKVLPLVAGAGMGALSGSLLAYLRHKNGVDTNKLDPGWYVFQRPLSYLPDLGVYGRHSGNLVILPREEADSLLGEDEWKRTSHKNFTGKDGQKLTAFVFDGFPKGNSPIKALAGMPMDIKFSKASDTFDVPLTDVTKVPLKDKVTLVDALRRLRTIDNLYAVLGEPTYSVMPKNDGGFTNNVVTNCHGITANILQETEDLHNLKEWSSSGFPSVRYTRRDEKPQNLQAILDKKYIPEMLRAGTAGSIMGGVIGAGSGGVYSSYEVNRRLNPTWEKIKGINTVGTLGLLGALGGGIVGMTGRGVQLALEKRKAKKELESLQSPANLKEAAVKDYAVHGLGGAAIGTAAGAMGNLALGRDILDHRLLLGGMGVGTAAGLFSGHVRSKEREQYEKSQQAVKLSYRVDEHGNPVKVDGKYIPRNGTYVVLRPLNYEDCILPTEYANMQPAYINNAVHGFKVTFTDKPITTRHKLEDGGEIIFKSVPYLEKDGKQIYAFYHQLHNDGRPREDGIKHMSRAGINGRYLDNDTIRNGEFYNDRFTTDSYGTVFDRILNPVEGDTNSQYGRIIPLQYDDDDANGYNNAVNRVRAINNYMLRRKGELGKYTMIETPWGKWTGSTNNCLTFLVYLTRALEKRNLINLEKTKSVIPRYWGIGFSADSKRHNYNKVFGDFD